LTNWHCAVFDPLGTLINFKHNQQMRSFFYIGLSTTILVILSLELFFHLRYSDDFFFVTRQYDKDLGRVLIPNNSFHYTKEGDAIFKTNSVGFNDCERSIIKQNDIYRVSVIGDSFVESMQVPRNENFVSLAEKTLGGGCPSNQDEFQKKSVEVLNFGISGYGLHQYTKLLKHKVQKFNSDLVIIVIYEENDWMDGNLDVVPERKGYYPMAFIDESGFYKEENSFKNKNKEGLLYKLNISLLKNSRLFYFIRNYRSFINLKNFSSDQEPINFSHENALKLARIELEKLFNLASKLGSQLAFLYIPVGPRVYSLPTQRSVFLGKFERIVSEFSSSNKIPMKNMFIPFHDAYENDLTVSYGFEKSGTYKGGHLNQKGHKIVSNFLVELVSGFLTK
jgi:hypothetical protein